MPRARDVAQRLVVSVAFVVGVAAFCGLVVPLGVAAGIDDVPVLPIAVMVALAAGLLGGVAAAAVSLRWWGFLLALVLGTMAGATASVAGRAAVQLVGHGAAAWGLDRFDTDRWQEASTRADGYNPRGKMVARLLLSRRLVGLDRAEVRALLGPPDCSAPDDPFDAWHIGSWTGFQVRRDCVRLRYAGPDADASADAVEVAPDEGGRWDLPPSVEAFM